MNIDDKGEEIGQMAAEVKSVSCVNGASCWSLVRLCGQITTIREDLLLITAQSIWR